jgi:5-methylcytosine-specific restriction endonuclease McrA
MTTISDQVREAVIKRAGRACEYCRMPDRLQAGGFELDHILPRSRGGLTTLDNLAYACPHCNDRKWAHVDGQDPTTGETTPLFHPRQDRWDDHFAWSEEIHMEIVGKTPAARGTVARLQLNHPELLEIRRELVKLNVLVIPQDSR